MWESWDTSSNGAWLKTPSRLSRRSSICRFRRSPTSSCRCWLAAALSSLCGRKDRRKSRWAPFGRRSKKSTARLWSTTPQTMDKIISDSLAARRFSMILLGIFAALALVLSCVGIYGVISYLAGQRTHEIGIRMALGAQRNDVLRLILGHGAKMALIGVAVGIAASLALTRLMAKLLFGVSAYDPLTFLAVAACYFWLPWQRPTFRRVERCASTPWSR